jgi:hypothetical protein
VDCARAQSRSTSLAKNILPPHNMIPRAEVSASSSVSVTSHNTSVVRVLAASFDNLMRTQSSTLVADNISHETLLSDLERTNSGRGRPVHMSRIAMIIIGLCHVHRVIIRPEYEITFSSFVPVYECQLRTMCI